MRVVIAGGNGFIGRGLTRRLVETGDEVVWLSHRPGTRTPPATVRELAFPTSDSTAEWTSAVAGADAVVNLSGHPIASRWNPEVKEVLVRSRLDTSRALGEAIREARAAGTGPAVYVGASGIGIYGDRGDEVLREDAAPGDDWLAKLACDWEAEGLRASESGCRAVALRTGLALGDEGLVPRLVLPMKLFVGGPVGNGRQWMSWIHFDDIVGLYAEALRNAAFEGPVNACAPEPVRSRDFAAALGRALHRPSWLPVPGPALRIVLGEVAPYTLFSQRACADKARAAGYDFVHSNVTEALAEVVARAS